MANFTIVVKSSLTNVKKANTHRVFPKKCCWSPKTKILKKLSALGPNFPMDNGHDLEVLDPALSIVNSNQKTISRELLPIPVDIGIRT